MSWIRETHSSWWFRLACNILKAGPMPAHVAFIMDGNRRFARKHGYKNVLTGHSLGFEKLAETLEWCRDLGIVEVSVYAFSIENFKRSKQEVDGIMELAKAKLLELINEQEKLEKHQVRISFFGNISLLPMEIQRLAARIMHMTKDYDRHRLNVCIAYASQDEICRAMKNILKGVNSGTITVDDISTQLISECLDTGESRPPDLLIRTSGELRLSDFMLWQCCSSCVQFDSVLWPEFGFRHLFYAILRYQCNVALINNLVKGNESLEDDASEERKKLWMKQCRSELWEKYSEIASVAEDASY